MPVKNKKYSRLKVTEHHRRLKRKAVQYKGGCCQVCGYDRSLAALVFHHRIPDQKDFSVSQLKSASWETLRLELDKCDLLCSNCHNEIHEVQATQTLEELKRQVRAEVPIRDGHKQLELKCTTCGEVFSIYQTNRPNARFCSRSCRVAHNAVNWPSVEELKSMILRLSPSQIAGELGCHSKTVRVKLHSLGISWKSKG